MTSIQLRYLLALDRHLVEPDSHTLYVEWRIAYLDLIEHTNPMAFDRRLDVTLTM